MSLHIAAKTNEPGAACADVTERILDEEALRHWPLPVADDDGDKEDRGKVVIVAGSREMPGAVILAAVAALRAGAGKLVVATGASIAGLVAAAVPEARVLALDETAAGGLDTGAADRIAGLVGAGDGILIGPGMQDEHAICTLVAALLPQLGNAKVVLDAAAMGVVCSEEAHRHVSGAIPGDDHWHLRGSFAVPVLLTPHAGEMAHLTGLSKTAILKSPAAYASEYAKKWRAVVALKGATTFIAASDGSVWRHDGGNVGLAVSGSGDALAGIIVGLVARGASLRQAAAWGVALHARAGEELAQRIGPLGYLAREIADRVPALMQRLGEPRV
ncbi:MAG: NAD(P)H-hydrate dehydratase [Rhodocyclales bacterium]|nr:NAD(P)H-hydrate dehydratase [Rhodocyclales bacterium]